MKVDLLRVAAPPHEIAVLRYAARRARGIAIVAAHGYSSSKQNLDLLCAFLASHGFDVWSLDFPGHKLGATGGRLRSAQDLVDAMAAVAAAARDTGARAVYALGHSMGATTALCTTALDPGIAGTVAIATGWGRPTALNALAARGVVDLRSGYVDGPALPELAAAWEPLVAEALAGLAGRPTLVIAAERDGMVSRASVEDLFARIPEPKAFATVASDHTFAGDASRAAVLAWLNERHGRDPAPPEPIPAAPDVPL